MRSRTRRYERVHGVSRRCACDTMSQAMARGLRQWGNCRAARTVGTNARLYTLTPRHTVNPMGVEAAT